MLARGGELGSGENTEMKSEEMMDEESFGDGKREREAGVSARANTGRFGLRPGNDVDRF